MRRTLCTAGLAIALLAAGTVPALAAGSPQRPDGPVVPIAPSENGGDNGWGNCGHNSSGGNPHSDPDGGGNGGYTKDECGSQTPPDPTGPGDGGGSPPT